MLRDETSQEWNKTTVELRPFIPSSHHASEASSSYNEGWKLAFAGIFSIGAAVLLALYVMEIQMRKMGATLASQKSLDAGSLVFMFIMACTLTWMMNWKNSN